MFIFKFDNQTAKKYSIKAEENTFAFKICSNKFDDLFVCGKSDIHVKRSNVKSKSNCIQQTFNYENDRNALCDNSKSFTPKRFYIYQMKEYEIDQIERLATVMLNKEQRDIIEKWTNRSFGKVMFDSERESYESLPKRLEHNGQFLMICDTNFDVLIGGYVEGCLMNKYKSVDDENAFVYSFKEPNGQKYPIHQLKKAFAFETGLHEYHFNFGYNDITMMKKDNMGSIHQDEESTFDYRKDRCALLGYVGSGCFKPLRVQFIQMN